MEWPSQRAQHAARAASVRRHGRARAVWRSRRPFSASTAALALAACRAAAAVAPDGRYKDSHCHRCWCRTTSERQQRLGGCSGSSAQAGGGSERAAWRAGIAAAF